MHAYSCSLLVHTKVDHRCVLQTCDSHAIVFSYMICSFRFPFYRVWTMPMETDMLVVHASVSQAHLMPDQVNSCDYILEYFAYALGCRPTTVPLHVQFPSWPLFTVMPRAPLATLSPAFSP